MRRVTALVYAHYWGYSVEMYQPERYYTYGHRLPTRLVHR